MRSDTGRKISDETPQPVKDQVRKDWRDFYRSIPLTPEELEDAILEGQKAKFFRERAKDTDGSMKAKNSSVSSLNVVDSHRGK